MKLPLQVVFRNFAPSDAVSLKVDEHIAKLEKLCDRIVGCQVAIEKGQRGHQQGGLFNVRVSLRVPDAELVASHAADEDHSHEDLYVALRDAFDSIRRQLDAHLDRRSKESRRGQGEAISARR